MTDHEHLLLLLLAKHTSMGPKQAATALGWTKEQVAQAKEALASKGLIRLGKGGSMQVAQRLGAKRPLAGNLLAPEPIKPVTKKSREAERPVGQEASKQKALNSKSSSDTGWPGHWIAPTERDTERETLEKKLWDAADEMRANSGLKASEYSNPVLGLLFLRFAEVRYAAARKELEAQGASSRRGNRADEPAAYHAKGIIYLEPAARYDHLLGYPEGGKDKVSLAQAVNEAMRAIERDNPQLAGVLPKTYERFSDPAALKSLLKTISTIPASLEFDAFGRIYEYFLGEFARSEGQKGGEFFTPLPIVRLLVEVLEPFHGRILDPACGSGGMFVQSARFVSEHRKNPSSELSVFGMEKEEATTALARMNLAMHGLEGDVKQAISYYDDPHNATGRFDYVLANPPFNVNKVDKERLESMVGHGRRYPYGVPRTDNANYLWIQLFHSALNAQGRAGFVMANSASDARSSEQDIRRQLLEDHAVDVMVSVGPNMFYTVTLPCTLWFLDKGKRSTARKDTVLFLDARHIYRQVDRAHRDWTEAQIGFLANIVRLYRGEEVDVTFGGPEALAKLTEIFGVQEQGVAAWAMAAEPTERYAKLALPTRATQTTADSPSLRYRDIPGLCKAATLADIAAQGYSLNPGRYVGVVPGADLSDEDFQEKLQALNEELVGLNAQARQLEETIEANITDLLD
ncbi:MAG: SAM-dependent DNA methyltransferase [Flavobacteriales bacterium]|nr:SAM-dependent DNA methyltransferase [Flavobacteriales bacterium]